MRMSNLPTKETQTLNAVAGGGAVASAIATQTDAAKTTTTKKTALLNADVCKSREKHWAITEWLAKRTSAAVIERAFNDNAKSSSSDSSRNTSPTSGLRQ